MSGDHVENILLTIKADIICKKMLPVFCILIILSLQMHYFINGQKKSENFLFPKIMYFTTFGEKYSICLERQRYFEWSITRIQAS